MENIISWSVPPRPARTSNDPAAHSPARFISITRARCIARYKMRSVPGRPEELRGVRTISFGYCGGELRIRKHGGRDDRAWIDHVDIKLADGWLDKVYAFLDEWMGYIPSRDIKAPCRA